MWENDNPKNAEPDERLDDLEASPILKTECINHAALLHTQTKNHPINVISSVKANLWPDPEGSKTSDELVGFRSGSGKPLPLSKEALDRAKQMWEEITVSEDNLPLMKKTLQSVKPIALSKEALEKAQALWGTVAHDVEPDFPSNNNAEIETGLKRTRDEESGPETPILNPLPKLNPSKSDHSHTPVTSRLRQLGVRRSGAFSTPTLRSRVLADAAKGDRDTSASPICRPNLPKRPRLPFKAPRISLEDGPKTAVSVPEILHDMADSPDFEELANQIMNELETPPAQNPNPKSTT